MLCGDLKKKEVILITVSSATTCTLCKISATACVSECLCKCPLACGNLHRTFLPQDNSNLHKTLKKKHWGRKQWKWKKEFNKQIITNKIQ